jgi:hypothetical protein
MNLSKRLIINNKAYNLEKGSKKNNKKILNNFKMSLQNRKLKTA